MALEEAYESGEGFFHVGDDAEVAASLDCDEPGARDGIDNEPAVVERDDAVVSAVEGHRGSGDAGEVVDGETLELAEVVLEACVTATDGEGAQYLHHDFHLYGVVEEALAHGRGDAT